MIYWIIIHILKSQQHYWNTDINSVLESWVLELNPLEARFLRNQEKERKWVGERKEKRYRVKEIDISSSLVSYSFLLLSYSSFWVSYFSFTDGSLATCATLALLCMILMIFLLEFYGQMYSFELIRILKPGENKLEYEGGSCQTKRWVGSFINGKWK